MSADPPSTALPSAPPPDATLAGRLAAALAAKRAAPGGYLPRTHHRDGDRPTYTNRLILETSPYLLQHAHNPVDWRPWGDEAFAEARRLARPVFLSIGYATCHWCHVMEAESFEDEEIAAFLNSHYVCVKVDREERPDVDAIYMAAVQALTGSGGWPLSLWLTPEREPFYGGTYFPPRDGARGAQHGFLTLLREIHATYGRDRERVGRASQALVQAVRAQMEAAAGAATATGPRPAVIADVVAVFRRLFDARDGGLRRAPKFPSNLPIRLLLRYYRRSGDSDALAMASFTLDKMAAGGINDQVGGGFHRYSTDAQWLVPHFEKMLYDNALLAVAYAEAHQVTGRRDFARVARETLDYLLREMTAPEGAFYSATDADSPGPDGKSEEGKFFVWSEEELRATLGPGDATEAFLRAYGVTAGGNFEGENILHRRASGEAAEDEHAAFASQRAALYARRTKRPPPLRDEKILAAWNGLAISAFAVGARVLGDARYLEAARRAAAFVLESMRPAGRLARSFKDGRCGAPGFLDDYAFVTAGLLDLFEASFEPRWLEAALALADETERLFADPAGGWFMTAPDHEQLIAREKSAYDGAEPSGTSVALLCALRLGTFTSEARWPGIAERALASIAPTLADNPLALTEALVALDYASDEPREIAIVGPAGWRPDGADPLLAVARRTFVPNRALAAAAEDQLAPLAGRIPFIADKHALDGKPTAYVCVQGRCHLPSHEPATLAELLGQPRPYPTP
jgi:uncharacterized protein YyaL (SSP411 family)